MPKYYTFRSYKRVPYDIDVYLDPKTITQAQEDTEFVWALIRYSNLNYGKKSAIEKFLAYHLEETTANATDFLKHTKDLIQTSGRDFAPFRMASGFALEWIKQQLKAMPLEPANKPDIKPKKTLPTFSELFRDPDKIKPLLSTLKARGIVQEDLTWVGITSARKTELVALIEILLQHGILKKDSKTKIGNIFSKEFRCEMNARNFNTSVKNKTIERVTNEIKIILPDVGR